MDIATSLFGRLGGQLGNIRLEVIGEQHTTHRPAVFFINHQSTLIDAMVTSRVVQRGFTVVAKAEVKQIPVLGQLLTLADVAFVERSNTSKAISAMQPAVEKLRAGISIVLAPEGTRSLSPRVGAFKKGGFHLARDAGVPIVPIVIRNAGEIMWRNAKVAQEGTIEVVVHEPVPTANWTRGDIDQWASRTRQLYLDALVGYPHAQLVGLAHPRRGHAAPDEQGAFQVGGAGDLDEQVRPDVAAAQDGDLDLSCLAHRIRLSP
jgi:putative phosphoserine phosphatase/1-acylglycerol-3-phosphate O-acyltransferase